MEGSLVLHEVVYFLGNVEDDDYEDDEEQRHEESDDEPARYVFIYLLHILALNLGTTESFQVAKSPAAICSRAVRTRSR